MIIYIILTDTGRYFVGVGVFPANSPRTARPELAGVSQSLDLEPGELPASAAAVGETVLEEVQLEVLRGHPGLLPAVLVLRAGERPHQDLHFLGGRYIQAVLSFIGS